MNFTLHFLATSVDHCAMSVNVVFSGKNQIRLKLNLTVKIAVQQSAFLLRLQPQNKVYSLYAKDRNGELRKLEIGKRLNSEVYSIRDNDTLYLIQNGCRMVSVFWNNFPHNTQVTKQCTTGEVIYQVCRELELPDSEDYVLLQYQRSSENVADSALSSELADSEVLLDPTKTLEEEMDLEDNVVVSLCLKQRCHKKEDKISTPIVVKSPSPLSPSPLPVAPVPPPPPPIWNQPKLVDKEVQTDPEIQTTVFTQTEFADLIERCVQTSIETVEAVDKEVQVDIPIPSPEPNQEPNLKPNPKPNSNTNSESDSLDIQPNPEPNPKPNPEPNPEPNPRPRPELLINAIHGLNFDEMVTKCRLVTLVVMDMRAEHVVLNIDSPVGLLVKEVCETLGLPHPSEWYFYKPNGLQVLLSGRQEFHPAFGLSTGGNRFKKTCFTLGSELVALENMLDSEQTLREQFDFGDPPFVLHMRHHNNKLMEGWEETDGGVLNQPELDAARNVFLSWYSITQGYCPVEEEPATNVAAILCEAKFASNPSPSDREIKDAVVSFLPEKYRKRKEIRENVTESYENLPQCSPEEAAQRLLQCVERLPAFDGVFFPIKIDKKSRYLKIGKMKERIFGVGSKEITVIKPSKSKDEVELKMSIHQIESFHASKTHFIIKFGGHLHDKFYAWTPRAFDIMNIMKLFIQQQPWTFEMSASPQIRNLTPDSIASCNLPPIMTPLQVNVDAIGSYTPEVGDYDTL